MSKNEASPVFKFSDYAPELPESEHPFDRLASGFGKVLNEIGLSVDTIRASYTSSGEYEISVSSSSVVERHGVDRQRGDALPLALDPMNYPTELDQLPEPFDTDRWHELLDLDAAGALSESDRREFEALERVVAELDALETRECEEFTAGLLREHEEVIASLTRLTEVIEGHSKTPRRKRKARGTRRSSR